jgi:hypothetical protein
MSGGRPPGPRRIKGYSREELTMARLQGESNGRTQGRLAERAAIVSWLKGQSGSPKDLATRITEGKHSRLHSED